MCVMFLSMSSCEYSDPVWRIVTLSISTSSPSSSLSHSLTPRYQIFPQMKSVHLNLPLDEPHGSTVPTECHPGHFLLHCVFQWGTVKGILALACLNHWYTKSFSSSYLLPVSCLLRLDVVFSW